MSNQKLGILAVAAAVMVFLAVITAHTGVGERGKLSGPAYLIQGLDTASIDSITIDQGKDQVKIQRKDGQFVVGDINYPADTKQINDLISKVLDIKTVELYTSDPKNHEELEVTEAKAHGIVKFFKADGSLLTGIIVGKTRDSGQGTYVRLVSSDDVYLTNDSPDIRTRDLDYMNQEIAPVKREDVNAVTVTSPEGSYTLRAEKGGDGVTMDGLPTGKKLKTSDAKSVFGALQGLRFEDVNTPDQLGELTFDHKYVVRMDNSTEYTLELAKKGDKTYLKAHAVYTSPVKVTINPAKKDSPEELEKKETILKAQEAVQRFTLRHTTAKFDWIYTIPDWKAKSLLMPQSDLLEDVAKPVETKVDVPAQATQGVVPSVPAEAPVIGPNQPTATPQAAEPNKP